ncbi:metallophosphoesterase [Couchioplanes caeruleus]|uniref:Metallophosphoesterase n=2 Tax=Couchioplanes caeruleus TaxID=56438 RepID=A0A1K0FLZ9_9ACTN|nr:metallophosphoesterase [Couchioplanes caeruleus subsp. caeruleus]ROP30699.1 calcineurin-like phosphoesterase family protein [Couchioplanes caeruleus]
MTDEEPAPRRPRTGSAEAEPSTARRPVSMDPQELGFTPQRPVGWLAPLLLLNTGLRTLMAILFGAYLDKRELQNALPGESFEQPGTDGELWLDYVSDLGDGFDATYSVAYLLAQPGLEVGGRTLPRGQMLVMGGDQVYPLANGDGYENRMKGPYRAALPEPPAAGPRPTLFALPGNHDWYDGLTAFLRLFARRKDGHIGGWRTQQRRSYFAVKLPADWWLFAIDEQFGAYIDDPQLVYFEKAAGGLGPADRIILMTPSPTWVKAAKKPGAYDSVDYFIRTILAPTGAQVRLLVSGDLHHYARYTGEDRELITCGGGGAYLLATHQLPEKLIVPPRETLTRNASRSREYALASRFPTFSESRRMSWGAFRKIPARNAGFATMLGIIQTLTMLAMAGAAGQAGIFQRLFSIPLVFMMVLILLGTVLFAQPPEASQDKHARHWILGLVHGFAHIALAAGGSWLWLRLPFHEWSWPGPLVVAAILYGPVIALLATQLLTLYLLIASLFDVNVNELFAGQGIEDSKSFLRMHIAADGTLTIHPLGVDKICHRWKADPHGAPDSSWLHPVTSLRACAIEPPIVVD